jgi:hypothetical protein
MNENTYFENSLTDAVCRRAFAARLDMTLKRAKMTSKRVAQCLGVPEYDVTLWRAGVTVPVGTQCRRLSELLRVDVAWLCVGQA